MTSLNEASLSTTSLTLSGSLGNGSSFFGKNFYWREAHLMIQGPGAPGSTTWICSARAVHRCAHPDQLFRSECLVGL